MQKVFIDRLISIRERAGLSARKLSLMLERHEDYMSKLERCLFAPSVDDLMAILEKCGSSLEEFFYSDFDSYSFDKKVITEFKQINVKGYENFLTFLLNASQDDKKTGSS